jgi:hypothetical protein
MDKVIILILVNQKWLAEYIIKELIEFILFVNYNNFIRQN